jgi:hypothetical protein
VLVANPFFPQIHRGEVIVSASMTLVLISAVLAVGGDGRLLVFKIVTLTCLGCNDIVPVSRVARMLMMVEATTGVLYLAVMIARLVALYSRPNVRETT